MQKTFKIEIGVPADREPIPATNNDSLLMMLHRRGALVTKDDLARGRWTVEGQSTWGNESTGPMPCNNVVYTITCDALSDEPLDPQ